MKLVNWKNLDWLRLHLFVSILFFSFWFQHEGQAASPDESSGVVANPTDTKTIKDKEYIELSCGEAKASITCTKYDKNLCVASILAFDTEDGKHIVKPYKVPQHFAEPTIADTITCITTPDKNFFSVFYTPGCQYSGCIIIDLFDISGKRFPRTRKAYSQAVGTDKQTFTHITLRERKAP